MAEAVLLVCCAGDFFNCARILYAPKVTLSTKTNPYVRLLPFLLTSIVGSVALYFTGLRGWMGPIDNAQRSKNMFFIVMHIISALVMYAGMACPLPFYLLTNFFKPFEVVKRQHS
jgi:hypothetical protein